MICFITDIRTGEKDILTPVKHKTLTITSLDGADIDSFDSPKSGWSHDGLVGIAEKLAPRAATTGADAYLGGIWVGSTEV